MDLYKATESKKGAEVGMWWWEQADIDFAGTRETAETAAEADDDGQEE